jgi:hypothetical protein
MGFNILVLGECIYESDAEPIDKNKMIRPGEGKVI